ncbi:UDP-galactose transporter senju [Cimex lectularius]|uniref:UDP-galactose transporter n=1 Tax=Cimex lectularius TaxID=79782 RepID=A0A8I6RZ70_CIMLE|nr:UDP-galactose transporter senju [Cimex lectularius]
MKLSSNLQEVFPTKQAAWIFAIYITLFVNQGWLVTASQESNNHYNYDIALAVLLTEFLKLICSFGLYSYQYSLFNLVMEFKGNMKVFALYFVPASLYAVYNNLTYMNLSTFDPTTYFVALQMRVVLTGIVFQLIFNKKLSFKQWLSLVVLTVGCMVKQIDFGDMPDKTDLKIGEKELSISYSLGSLLLIAQILCSCLAGVYNEYLLKMHAEEVNVYIQNAYHYINSIICLVVIFTWQGKFTHLFFSQTYKQFLDFKVAFVIINNVAIGIVTSFFLKYLNSILKTFAGALELVFTAVIARILFGIPIYLNTLASIGLIVVATIVYSQNPVTKPTKAKGELPYV